MIESLTTVTRRAFRIDWSQYERILKDVNAAPEEYRPHDYWLTYERSVVPQLRMDPSLIYTVKSNGIPVWVGGGTQHEVPWERYDRFIPFVRELDEMRLLDKYPSYRSKQFLDAVIEINLMRRYCGLRDGMRLVDLGGGYGRLAEFLLPEFNVSYVIVDAVALSLLVATQYLPQMLGTEVNSYWETRDKRCERYRLSVWPAWDIESILPGADIMINIHSMQEMGDSRCAFYLKLFDRYKGQKTSVFLKNNFKFVTRTWEFPTRWTVVYENNTWPCSEGLVDGVWQDAPRTWLKIFR